MTLRHARSRARSLFNLGALRCGPLRWCSRPCRCWPPAASGCSRIRRACGSGACRACSRGIAGLDLRGARARAHPGAPAIYAFKHQSAWETLVLNLLFPDPAIVLKRELTQIPLFGWYLLHAGMIRIDRAGGARALRDADRRRPRRARARLLDRDLPRGHPRAGRRAQSLPAGRRRAYRQLDCPVVPVALNSGCSGDGAASSSGRAGSSSSSCRRSRRGSSARRSWPSSSSASSARPTACSPRRARRSAGRLVSGSRLRARAAGRARAGGRRTSRAARGGRPC